MFVWQSPTASTSSSHLITDVGLTINFLTLSDWQHGTVQIVKTR